MGKLDQISADAILSSLTGSLAISYLSCRRQGKRDSRTKHRS